MKSLAGRAGRGLTWLAVLWTIHEEQRHLGLYLGAREIALGIGEYIDIAATLVLLLYAGYEVFHFLGRSGALDRLVAGRPTLAELGLLLLAALAWGIYRDLGHFHHLFLGTGASPLDDEFDAAAAGFLGLGALKTGYHAFRAAPMLARLRRRHL